MSERGADKAGMTHIRVQVVLVRCVGDAILCGRCCGSFSCLSCVPLALFFAALEFPGRGSIDGMQCRHDTHVLDIISPVTGSLCVPVPSEAIFLIVRCGIGLSLNA